MKKYLPVTGLLSLVLTFICGTLTYAQGTPDTLYYSMNWIMVQPGAHAYYRIVDMDTINGELSFRGPFKDFYRDGTPLAIGNYTDGLLDGLLTTFHYKGPVYNQGSYHKGKKSGEWKYYTAKGKVYEVIEYDDYDFSVKLAHDENGRAVVQNGTGKWEKGQELPDGTTFYISGEFVNGKKDGNWKYRYRTMWNNAKEKFKEGEFIRGYIGSAGRVKYTDSSKIYRQVFDFNHYELADSITASPGLLKRFYPKLMALNGKYRYKSDTSVFFENYIYSYPDLLISIGLDKRLLLPVEGGKGKFIEQITFLPDGNYKTEVIKKVGDPLQYGADSEKVVNKKVLYDGKGFSSGQKIYVLYKYGWMERSYVSFFDTLEEATEAFSRDSSENDGKN